MKESIEKRLLEVQSKMQTALINGDKYTYNLLSSEYASLKKLYSEL